MAPLSHPYTTTGKTIALTIWTSVSKRRLYCYVNTYPTQNDQWPYEKGKFGPRDWNLGWTPRNYCQQQLLPYWLPKKGGPADTLTFIFQLPGLRDNLLLFKPVRLWYFVPAAPENKYRRNLTSNFLQLPISCRSPSWCGSMFTSASIEHLQGWDHCPWGNTSNYWITPIISLYGYHTFAK